MKNVALIDDFFAGKLSETQQHDFEKLIESDPELKDLVKTYVNAKIATQQEVYELKKNQFAQLHKSLNQKEQKSKYFILASGVAAAILLCFFSWFMFFDAPNPSVYAQNYIKENLSTLSSQMSVNTDSLNIAIELYNKGDFTAAQNIFKLLPTTPHIIEYQGLCYLQNKQFNQALLKFQQLDNQQELMNNKGKFYKALTLTLQGKNDLAKHQLEKFMLDSQSENTKKQAIKLLELL